ncbi:FAD-binding oxidoreductase [Yimella sp. cx-51]|nr:FAD-binding oxidoreductase [Yimella sp. cx-51]MBC9955622.1 FAD-binding oxidoreductase [Yimella sp. cx-51]QTH39685.1 FAD-binding oxidoreductase [Yimella sp. cx-51]
MGGGVIGLSTAYHLAKAGVRDVVVVETNQLGSGSTCKAAGGVRAMFSDEINVIMGKHSLDVFERFGELFDQEIDLHQVGYLFLLDNDEDVADFERTVQLQQSLGIEAHMIDPTEAKRRSPLIDITGIKAAAFSPRDGHCTPESVVLGYARAARKAGVRIITGCEVTGAEVSGGRIRVVETSRGRIEADTVVCATGAWSGKVAGLFGVDLPVTPMRRQILVTEPMTGLPSDTPFTIDFATSLYFHNEGPGLLLGMSDKNETEGFKLNRGEEWLPGLFDAIERRAPSLAEVGMASGWAGLYEMTPDHNGLVGQADDLPGFYYCTGFSGHGFLLGPALGEVMRDLIRGDQPMVDISCFDVARFAHATRPEKNIV